MREQLPRPTPLAGVTSAEGQEDNMTWSKEERRDNAMRTMRANIDRDTVGRRLTPEAKERAAEFAVDVWKGNMGNGEASKIGIKHVTRDVFKD